MRWRRSVDAGQGMLFPVDLRSLLPADHRAWLLLEVISRLDLSEMTGAYRADGQGGTPYDPAMMVAVLFYCYDKGIRASRKIAAACVDDLGCRVITGGLTPAHKAFCDFIRLHRAALEGMFVQVLRLLAEEGLVQGQIAAVDGSPVSANAAMSSNADAARLDRQIAAAEAALAAGAAAWLDGTLQAAAQDGAQERLWHDDDDDQSGPGSRRLSALTARLARLHAARDKLTAREQVPGSAAARVAAARDALARAEARLARAETAQAELMDRYLAVIAAGRKWRGIKPVPADRNVRIAQIRKNRDTARARLDKNLAAAGKASPVQVSGTDPDSRLMPGKTGGYLQGWNLQLAAARRQVLLAIELHDSPCDQGALEAMITAALANCDLAGLAGRIRAWLADNGYASAAAFARLEHLLLLVAVRKDRFQAGRATPAEEILIPQGWEKMAARLATPAGKSLYKRRAALVEPAFAQLFDRLGRYVNYRGRTAVNTEIKIMGTVHNLAKLLDALIRRPRPAPA